MGLFNPIKKGTYTFITENIALIYYVIKHDEHGSQLTKDQQLFATAKFDTLAYKFPKDDLINALVCSYIQQVNIFIYSKQHGKNYTSDERDLLVGLTMQLLAMIFEVEFKTLSPEKILTDIVKKKPLIESTIAKTLAENEKHILYPAVSTNVGIWLNNPSLRKKIDKFELPSKF